MVRNDTVPVIGRNLEFEIKSSKKTIPLLAKMMDLDARTIYKSVKSENVAPSVIRKYANHFKLPISFFTNHIKDEDIILRPIKTWKTYSINSQFDQDYDYELRFDSKITKGEFSEYDKLIRTFLWILGDTLSKKKSSKKDKFAKLDIYKNFLELSSMGEKLNDKYVTVYIGRYLYWKEITIRNTYDEPLRTEYNSYSKQHLIFTNEIPDEIPYDLHYSKVDIGELPPNPYENFKNNPNSSSITINDYEYSKEDFKNFWGGNFNDRRESVNDDFINEFLSIIEGEVAENLAPGFNDSGAEINYHENTYKELESLLEERDKDIKSINEEEEAQDGVDYDNSIVKEF